MCKCFTLHELPRVSEALLEHTKRHMCRLLLGYQDLSTSLWCMVMAAAGLALNSFFLLEFMHNFRVILSRAICLVGFCW